MEGKLFNNFIEFKFIRNIYPTSERLFCYFQTPCGGLWQPEIGDWVGLYKMGWNLLKEHKIRKSIQSECLETRKSGSGEYTHVVFEQHELPVDVEGMYQFVYVTKNDLVRGASKPFQFERVLPREGLKTVNMWSGELAQQTTPYQQQYQQLYPQQYQQQLQHQHQHHQQQQQQQRLQEQLREQQRLIDIEGKTDSGIPLPKILEREIGLTTTGLSKIENELIKECQRLNLNWGKVNEDVIVGKLIQKYLSNMRTIQNGEEVPRRLDDLVTENNKLCMSLKTRIQEVAELKKDCEEMKMINGDLLNKLTVAERKCEQLERDREEVVRRGGYCEDVLGRRGVYGEEIVGRRGCIDEITRETPFGYEKIQGKQQPTQVFCGEKIMPELDEQTEETEKVFPELKRVNSYYTCLDGQIETPRVRLVQRTEEQPTSLPTPLVQKRNQLIEKILREVDGTSSNDVRLLKRVIVDLNNDNEKLRIRSRQVEDEKEEIQVPLNKTINIKEIRSISPIELVSVQDRHTMPMGGESLPTITVSTVLPEVQTTKTITVTGKINEQQYQTMKQLKEQEQQTTGLRGQTTQEIYLNKINEHLKSKIEERLRTKLQEQLKEQLRNKFVEPTGVNKIEEVLRQKVQQHYEQQLPKQQQTTPWGITEDVVLPQWRVQQQLEEHTRKIKEQLSNGTTQTTTTTSTVQTLTICPVCGIAMPKELNVCDFEIHVNSHFTD